ncbi:MAG: hypothetical protein H5U40_11995 [Polyangiaceae bacterium]|nr:hypothetical protein [Polyangiaceae bacterium]
MTSLPRFSTLALLGALSLAGCGDAEADRAVEVSSAATGDEPDPQAPSAPDVPGDAPLGSSEPPEPGACIADDDCREEDNYCGGCHCLALGPGETAPTCRDPVACFASPCSVTPGRLACVDRRCVRRPSDAPSQ